MKNGRYGFVLVFLIGIIVVLGGCGGQGQQQQQQASKSLSIGVEVGASTLQRNFNPFSPNKLEGTSYMYEPLYVINSLNGKETPWLATSYEWQDNQTLVMDVRSEAKWSDGESFSAEDVAFTFNLLKENSELDTNGLWNYLSSVEAQDEKVTFKYKEAAVPTFTQVATTPIVPEHVWSDIESPVESTNDDPVVTGPYTVASFNKNQYTLEKNSDYWQADKVNVSRLNFPALSGNENAQLKLVQGDLQWSTLYIPDVENAYVDKGDGNEYWFPGGGAISLIPNLTKAPFDDVKFREAMAYALDREAMTEKGASGYPDPASQTGLLLPGQEDLLASGIENQGIIQQDMDEAAQLLSDAGYEKNSDGNLMGKDGEPINFDLTVVGGFTDWIQAAKVARQNLGELGITVNVKTPTFNSYDTELRNGGFDTAFAGVGNINPYLLYNNTLASQNTAPVGESASSNFSRFEDEQTDQLLAEYRRTVDEGEQEQITHQLEQIAMEQFPVIPLYYGPLWSEYSTSSFTGWPNADDPYASPVPYGAPPYGSEVLKIMTSLQPTDS